MCYLASCKLSRELYLV